MALRANGCFVKALLPAFKHSGPDRAIRVAAKPAFRGRWPMTLRHVGSQRVVGRIGISSPDGTVGRRRATGSPLPF